MNDRGSSTEKSNVLEAVKIGVELGFANPHYLLGKMLLRGLCVEKDIIEGVRHLEAAVKMGHAKAQEIKEFLETFRR
ncbi:MAG TPA: hypothetical protein PLU54_09695 [Deltaproteobacteria bacterium]|nr:hypothetical protein [Deltaproteobacteria bacterium]